MSRNKKIRLSPLRNHIFPEINIHNFKINKKNYKYRKK